MSNDSTFVPTQKAPEVVTHEHLKRLLACQHKGWGWVWETDMQGRRVWTSRARCLACNQQKELV